MEWSIYGLGLPSAKENHHDMWNTAQDLCLFVSNQEMFAIKSCAQRSGAFNCNGNVGQCLGTTLMYTDITSCTPAYLHIRLVPCDIPLYMHHIPGPSHLNIQTYSSHGILQSITLKTSLLKLCIWQEWLLYTSSYTVTSHDYIPMCIFLW